MEVELGINRTVRIRGLQRNVYLCWPIAPLYMSPNAGEGGSWGVSTMSLNMELDLQNKSCPPCRSPPALVRTIPIRVNILVHCLCGWISWKCSRRAGTHLLAEWLATHRTCYTSCKDDLKAFPLCILTLFVLIFQGEYACVGVCL